VNKFSGNNIFGNQEQGYLLKGFSYFLAHNSCTLHVYFSNLEPF